MKGGSGAEERRRGAVLNQVRKSHGMCGRPWKASGRVLFAVAVVSFRNSCCVRYRNVSFRPTFGGQFSSQHVALHRASLSQTADSSETSYPYSTGTHSILDNTTLSRDPTSGHATAPVWARAEQHKQTLLSRPPPEHARAPSAAHTQHARSRHTNSHAPFPRTVPYVQPPSRTSITTCGVSGVTRGGVWSMLA